MATFRCEGCGTVITVKKREPKQRQFTWKCRVTKQKHFYCFDCDTKLIADTPDPKGAQWKTLPMKRFKNS